MPFKSGLLFCDAHLPSLVVAQASIELPHRYLGTLWHQKFAAQVSVTSRLGEKNAGGVPPHEPGAVGVTDAAHSEKKTMLRVALVDLPQVSTQPWIALTNRNWYYNNLVELLEVRDNPRDCVAFIRCAAKLRDFLAW